MSILSNTFTDATTVETVNSGVSLESLRDRCKVGTTKTFFYNGSTPTLPSFLSGTLFLFVTIFRSKTGMTIYNVAGIVGIDGSILHGYGYYTSGSIIWTSK